MKIFALICFTIIATSTLQSTPLKVPTEKYARWPELTNHPGYAPFISYLTYRKMANIVIDQTTEWFDPDTVKQGDIIYINIWYLEWFAAHVHDRIPYPYILISADVGNWLPAVELKKLLYDPKLAAWFCRNIIFSNHPKIFQIPMGSDLALFHPGVESMDVLKEAIACKPFAKKHLLYMNHYPRDHGDRKNIVRLFENEPYCYSKNHSDERGWEGGSRASFYQDIGASTFILSPLGLETDCIRTWEALLLDCIPIVEHTFIDPLFDQLPVVMVHEWEEINQVFLEKKLQELKLKSLKPEIAYSDYWHEKILNIQKKVQNSDLAFCRLEATLFDKEDLQDLQSIIEKDTLLHSNLVYKGALTALRPLQLASIPFLYSMFLDDPWMDQTIMDSLDHFVVGHHLLKHREKILTQQGEDYFRGLHQFGCPVFLDLTYFRTSALISLHHFFRHSLKNDLNQIYREQPEGSLLCGNMATHDYVREVLDKFSQESNVKIHQKGNFWFCHKLKSQEM